MGAVKGAYMVNIFAEMIIDYHTATNRLPNKLVLTPDDAAAFCVEVQDVPMFGNRSPIGQVVCGCTIVEAPKAAFSFVTFDPQLTR